MVIEQLKELLNQRFTLYNTPDFISTDPISIPHSFSKREDIEVAAFCSATIAWGNRASIVKNGQRLMQLMDEAPYDFVMNASSSELKRLSGFVHRTFNADDAYFFTEALRNIYLNHQGPEQVFAEGLKTGNRQMDNAIVYFRKIFLETPHLQRSEKHIANPARGSSAKRINMFLRWMVRNDNCGVDFGIWKNLSPADLYCPLDVHSGNVARKLGLLSRKQNDWQAAAELTGNLRKLDPQDPVKYDFALFGMGVFEKF